MMAIAAPPVKAGCSEIPAFFAAVPNIKLKLIADGLKQPVHITHARDEPDRLYVVEQAGQVRIIEKGKLLVKPFLDIRDRVNSGGEKGLLSIALHPDYKNNGFIYVNYTMEKQGLQTIVSRFGKSKDGQVKLKSEKIILKIKQPYSNHNGGQLAFGPDGYLYIGMGDGGSANDPLSHGQNTRTLLGTLLRIDINSKGKNKNYVIPDDNPFLKAKNFLPEIWAYGLRNPWRFSFDKATKDLYLADVGQDAVEEINIIKKGGNYGWNIMEGDFCFSEEDARCKNGKLKSPVHVYYHPEGFSVTGGFVYRGDSIPGLCGVYLFADYVTEKIWGIRVKGGKSVKQKVLISKGNLVRHTLSRVKPIGLNISSFGEDESGELYIADHGHGRIYKIVPTQ